MLNTWLGYSHYATAFVVGLLGGVHCMGMCGGIVSALTFSLPAAKRQQLTNLMPMLLAYNTGRIGGYMLAGALAGGVGGAILTLGSLEQLRHILQWISALFNPERMMRVKGTKSMPTPMPISRMGINRSERLLMGLR